MLQLPYQKLQIWQKSMQLAKTAYHVTDKFPQQEMYGLTSQIRRAAVSIPSNIAEGSQRGTNKEFHHFISIARGSLAELETQLVLAGDLGMIPEKQLLSIIECTIELMKMIHAFQKSLSSSR